MIKEWKKLPLRAHQLWGYQFFSNTKPGFLYCSLFNICSCCCQTEADKISYLIVQFWWEEEDKTNLTASVEEQTPSSCPPHLLSERTSCISNFSFVCSGSDGSVQSCTNSLDSLHPQLEQFPWLAKLIFSWITTKASSGMPYRASCKRFV